jgi:hypothetical protein
MTTDKEVSFHNIKNIWKDRGLGGVPQFIHVPQRMGD